MIEIETVDGRKIMLNVRNIVAIANTPYGTVFTTVDGKTHVTEADYGVVKKLIGEVSSYQNHR